MTTSILRRGGSPGSVRRGDNQPNGINRLDPWNDFATMDRVFDNFFRSPLYFLDRGGSNGRSSSEPLIELYESGDELIAYLFAPGLDPSSLDVTAMADQLTVKCERKALLTASDNLVSHTQWSNVATSAGSFNAAYTLPVEINPNKVTATYRDGVLEIHLAKNEAAKPAQVKVQIN